MVSKFKKWFDDKKDQIKTSVRFERSFPFYFISMVLILLIAFLMRLTPVINNVFLIKAFDPWMQYYETKYLTTHGWYDFFHWYDYKSWYPDGIDRADLRPGLLFTAMLFYRMLQLLGINISLYEACFYFPAFMGTLTVLVMYYLGKEILDKKTGLLAAFFLAISPGHMQRTVAGFFDNETVGVFSVILVLLFFIRGIKRGKLMDGIYAGLSLGYLSLSWGGLAFPFLLAPVLTAVLILFNRYNTKVLSTYILTIGLGTMIYTLNHFFVWKIQIEKMEILVPLVWSGVLLGYHMFYIKRGTTIYQKSVRVIKWASIPLAITFIAIFWFKPEILPFNLGERLYSIINPNLREKIHLVASVGEHMPSPWSVFYYNAQIGLLLMIPGLYFAFRRNTNEDYMMIIFLLTIYYFTGSMIRIILLFAPAISLIAAYGLSNLLRFFGVLMQKEKKVVTRRRKRQLKRTLGRPEGITVYLIIATLLFIQVNHSVRISTTQMAYSELVAGGYYHDWEEALTWMKYNIDPNDPVVSWWDYGYWLTVIGNVTTVNDGATNNHTRIGLTGMAFMQTNERYSAEVFRWLHAKYVLVYFGHLINGLGGDEGKWPWMLRICNDHATYYREHGYYHDNWYSESEVFHEPEYINSSSGLYEDKWFETTLVKLMFNDEPTSIQSATTQTGAYFASQIEGNQNYGVQARKDDNGNLWSTHIPTNGKYNLQFFRKVYYSANNLVKIYEVDYTALDSSFEVRDPYMEDNGIGYVKVVNTGTTSISIDKLYLNGEEHNMTVEQGDISLAPGNDMYIWFDANEYNSSFTSNFDVFNVTVDASVKRDDGSTYAFSNSSNEAEIIRDPAMMKLSDIKIEENKSYLFYNKDSPATNQVEGFITVKNTGEKPILLDALAISDGTDTRIKNQTYLFSKNPNVEGESWDLADYTSRNFLIAPNEEVTYYFSDSVAPSESLVETRNISVRSADGKIDSVVMSFNTKGYDLDILGYNSLVGLPESSYKFNYYDYKPYSTDYYRYYVPLNDQSYLLENGTLILRVQNNGADTIAFQGLYVNDNPLDSQKWWVEGGDSAYFVGSGETRTIHAQIDGIERNEPVKITLTGEHVDTCTSITAYFVPVNNSAMIDIVDWPNSMTSLFTNDTIELVVKNVGKLPIKLTTLVLNGTSINIDPSYIKMGSNPGSLELNPQDIAVIVYQIPEDIFKINQSNSLTITVNTNYTGVASTIDLDSKLPTSISNDLYLKILFEDNEGSSVIAEQGFTEVSYLEDTLHVCFDVFFNQTATIDAIWVNTSTTSGYKYVDPAKITFYDEERNTISEWVFNGPETIGLVEEYYFDIDLADALGLDIQQGDLVWIKIITKEGYEAEATITA